MTTIKDYIRDFGQECFKLGKESSVTDKTGDDSADDAEEKLEELMELIKQYFD